MVDYVNFSVLINGNENKLLDVLLCEHD